MSSTHTPSAPELHHFVVWAPDRLEEGTFEKRLAVRIEHREKLFGLIQSGFINVGGVVLTPESVETATSNKMMTGSMLICRAENIEAVRKVIESDIYYTTGVWDPEKLVIGPFMPATPLL